jgi:hypothetical protein
MTAPAIMIPAKMILAGTIILLLPSMIFFKKLFINGHVLRLGQGAWISL